MARAVSGGRGDGMQAGEPASPPEWLARRDQRIKEQSPRRWIWIVAAAGGLAVVAWWVASVIASTSR